LYGGCAHRRTRTNEIIPRIRLAFGICLPGSFPGAHKGRELQFDRLLQPLVCEVDLSARKTANCSTLACSLTEESRIFARRTFSKGRSKCRNLCCTNCSKSPTPRHPAPPARPTRIGSAAENSENAHLETVVLETPDSADSDVDRKLVELARKTGAKIITNDFNLNKSPACKAFPS